MRKGTPAAISVFMLDGVPKNGGGVKAPQLER